MSVPRLARVPVLSLALALAPLAAWAQKPTCTTSVIKTQAGPICGLAPATGGPAVSAYLGIPYGQAQRWQNPQSTSWTATLNATAFGNICPQNLPANNNPACVNPPSPQPQGEDCLNLNIWVPSSATASSNLPVLVFMHGGAFVFGSGSAPVYDGSALATSGNVIVVTINYRLGAFGFLALPDLVQAGNTNFGLRDQIAAMQWVHDNISKFGGNPGNVTIVGESAGAMSVGLHALFTANNPQYSGLFNAAVMESNPFGVPYKSQSEALTVGSLFRTSMLCLDLNCMKGKTVAQILAAQKAVTAKLSGPAIWNGLESVLVWSPWIDGSLITGPAMAAADGKALKVPTLLGSNRDEGLLFVSQAFPQGIGPDVYGSLVSGLFSAAVLKAYPCSSSDCSAQLSQLITDGLFTCANRHLALDSQSSNTYAYEFTQVSGFKWPLPACYDEVCHGDELPYVFNTPGALCPSYTFTPPEQKLSNNFMGYWTSFGTSQNPNGGGRFTWPPFSSNKSYLLLSSSLSSASDPLAAEAQCTTIWESFYQSQPTWSRFVGLSPDKPDQR